jgi:hypothetical protein
VAGDSPSLNPAIAFCVIDGGEAPATLADRTTELQISARKSLLTARLPDVVALIALTAGS